MISTTLQRIPVRSFMLATGILLTTTTGCSSGPDYPEFDLAGDIPRHYQAPFTSDVPVIDGNMDDLAWRKANWTANFIELGGSTVSRPRYQSRAKLMWDHEYLYIGVWMVEPSLKSQPLTALSPNGLMLFVTNDAESGAYQLVKTEPGGRIATSTVNTDTDRAPLSAIVGMQYGVALSGTLDQTGDADKGWWVEFALPWRSLTSTEQASFQRAGAEWRMNLVREQQAWSPYFAHELYDAEMWSKVELVR